MASKSIEARAQAVEAPPSRRHSLGGDPEQTTHRAEVLAV
jgi:hypothetical protein